MANFLSNLYQKITTPSEKSIDKLIYGSMPKEDLSVPIKERLAGVRSNLSNYLLGAPAVTGQDDNSMPIYSSQERTGGAIRDFMNGFRENATNGFSPENWGQGKKNVATRIGEGLGSMARFMESPAGRALLVGGAVGLTGGNGLQALTFGTMTGAKNQSNRMADKLYRDDLIQTQQNTLRNNPAFNALSDTEKAQILSNLESTNQDYKNLSPEAQSALLEKAQNEFLASRQKEQLQDIADNINNRRGYITQDVYKNLVDSQQLRDNADWKKLYFDTNQKNLEAQRDWQRQQAKFDMWAKKQDIAQGWKKIENEKNKPNVNFNGVTTLRKEFAALAPVKNATEITRQYNNVNALYAKYKTGEIGKNAFDQALITTLNKVLDPTSVVRESEFDRTSAGQATWDKLAGYSQKLAKGGSGLTDANRADLVEALTTMKNANDKEVNGIVNDYAGLALRYGINPSDIMPRHYSSTGGKAF